MFDAALQWAMKADKTHFWRGGNKKPAKIESPHDSVAAIKKSATPRMKTDEYVGPAFKSPYLIKPYVGTKVIWLSYDNSV